MRPIRSFCNKTSVNSNDFRKLHDTSLFQEDCIMRVRQVCSVFATLFLCLSVFALCSAVSMWAQSVSSGTVVGTVTDQSGAVVSGGKVELTDLATSTTRSVTTNDTGHYVFVDVSPGQYGMTVSKQGFSTTKTNTEVKVGITTTTVSYTHLTLPTILRV